MFFKKRKKNNDSSSYDGDKFINWYKESYDTVVVQRNLLILCIIAAFIMIAASVFVIRYIRSIKSIEPFVIEIKQKTGMPTVVDAVSEESYAASDIIQRYFIIKYIKAREEYFSQIFDYNFQIVRALSTNDVFYEYAAQQSRGSPSSPVNVYGTNSTISVSWRVITFMPQQRNMVQANISVSVNGQNAFSKNKTVLMTFEFIPSRVMNMDQRMVNPLGFFVTLYRIQDDNTQSGTAAGQ